MMACPLSWKKFKNLSLKNCDVIFISPRFVLVERQLIFYNSKDQKLCAVVFTLFFVYCVLARSKLGNVFLYFLCFCESREQCEEPVVRRQYVQHVTAVARRNENAA